MFIGVDLAGENNTWAVVLRKEGERLFLEPALSLPEAHPVELFEIVRFSVENPVLGVAIDAPLTFGWRDRRGFRESDRRLRTLLKEKGGSPGWVVSYHVLRAVPVRGHVLAEALAPLVGTLLETHPRASLFWILPPEKRTLVRSYKNPGIPERKRREAQKALWRYLCETHHLAGPGPPEVNDGLVDALVCALTVFFFHHHPERLLFLPREPGAHGRGPFVVMAPQEE